MYIKSGRPLGALNRGKGLKAPERDLDLTASSLPASGSSLEPTVTRTEFPETWLWTELTSGYPLKIKNCPFCIETAFSAACI